jgi:hypothetical protein
MAPFLARALALLPLVLTAGCETTPWYSIAFTPAPAEVPLRADAVPGSQARVLATVLGLARADAERPERVEVRLRVENLGSVEARLAADAFSLLSADLCEFGPARLAGPIAPVAPGGSASLDLWFPLPPGRTMYQLDWGGLNLRLALEFQGTRVTTGVAFRRWVYDPYHVQVGYAVGYGW